MALDTSAPKPSERTFFFPKGQFRAWKGFLTPPGAGGSLVSPTDSRILHYWNEEGACAQGETMLGEMPVSLNRTTAGITSGFGFSWSVLNPRRIWAGQAAA